MSLVLGVVQVKELGRVPRESPAYRDGQRLLSLRHVLSEEYLPVHTVENTAQAEQKVNAHSVNISVRGARSLDKSLPDGFQFRLIIADYFRFPTEYYRKAYSALVPFLRTLYQLDRMHPTARTYVPIQNNNPLITQNALAATFGNAKMISSLENPWFYAADRLEKEASRTYNDKTSYLAGHSNYEQMRNNFAGFACASLGPYTAWKPTIRTAERCTRKCRVTRCLSMNRAGKQCCLCTRSETGLCHHHRK